MKYLKLFLSLAPWILLILFEISFYQKAILYQAIYQKGYDAGNQMVTSSVHFTDDNVLNSGKTPLGAYAIALQKANTDLTTENEDLKMDVAKSHGIYFPVPLWVDHFSSSTVQPVALQGPLYISGDNLAFANNMINMYGLSSTTPLLNIMSSHNAVINNNFLTNKN